MAFSKIAGINWMISIQHNFDQIESNRGVHAVTAGEATAHTVNIPTGNADFTGFTVQVFRSGINVLGDGVITKSGSSLVVSNGSTFTLTNGDQINWNVF